MADDVKKGLNFPHSGIIVKKFPYLSIEEIEFLYASSVATLYNLLYPFKSADEECESFVVPKRYQYWVVRCMIEFIEREGMSSVVGYAENGQNFSFDSAQLSRGLKAEITPFAGCSVRRGKK